MCFFVHMRLHMQNLARSEQILCCFIQRGMETRRILLGNDKKKGKVGWVGFVLSHPCAMQLRRDGAPLGLADGQL